MSGGREVARHAAWNLAGQVVPIAVAVVALPMLVQRLGMDRFGFLTLVWVLVGYLGVFDFGVGRAMTRVVAERLAAHDRAGADALARAALSFLLLMGLLIGGLLLLAAPWVVDRLSLPTAMHGESTNACRLLAFSLPFVMLTAGYRGYLEARRDFAVLNLVRIAMGVLTYLAPLLATFVQPRLEAMVISVLLMRMLANYLHRRACLRHQGTDLRFERPRHARLKPLLALGGWMTVSNVVSPLMGSVDRLLIGALVPVAAIGMYATAFDLVSKVLIVAYSLTAALFPYFAGLTDGPQVRALYASMLKAMLLLVWPILFVTSLFARPLFHVWMGESFVAIAAPALQILSIGLLFNALAQVPAMLIQSRGSPKWMAIAHVIEMPVFLAAIYLLTQQHGVLGTAVAWSLRAAIDACVLLALVHRRLLPGALRPRLALALLALAPTVLLVPLHDWTPLQRIALAPGVLIPFVAVVWFALFDDTERRQLLAVIRGKLARTAAPSKEPP